MEYLVVGIERDPSEHPSDQELLMKVMKVLSKHKIVVQRYEKNFVFLKSFVALLKTHNYDFKGIDYHREFDDIQSRMLEIFQSVIKLKSNILLIQQQESESLKKKIKQF